MKRPVILLLLLMVMFLYSDNYRTIQRSTTIKANNGAIHKVGDFGNYYALLIYVEEYKNLKDLRTPKKDVEDIAKILRDRYGFVETKIVPNPKNSDDLIEILDNFKKRLNTNDNLLIYYAGHGSKNGYWQLSSAKRDSRVGWISIKEAINQTLKEMRSRHVLVVADSCYSGYLTRDGVVINSLSPNDKRYYSKLYSIKSRNVLTSGGLQPVFDQDPTNPNHSVFANGFLKMLQKNTQPIFSLEEQYPKVKRYVQLNTENQIPLYGDVKLTGHEDGGDFIFLDKKSIANGKGGEVSEYSLTINTTPSNATIQILNIKPYYQDRIQLKKGLYRIRVFADGYKEKRFNIELKEDSVYNIVLEKRANFSFEPQMVKIDRGSFIMGSDSGDSDEKPPHRVTIDYDFEIGKYEVTIGEYKACVADGGCKQPKWLESGSKYNIHTGSDDFYKKMCLKDNCPIIGVSWNNAKAYTKWLSRKTGKNYRLPTEAEWEFVARAGTTTKWCFGNRESKLKDYAWYYDNSNGKTHKVGTKKPNQWGVYDMHGNVCEWCEDWYLYSYNNTPKDGSANHFQKDNYKVLRGGSCGDYATNTRSANHYRNSPAYPYNDVGFRLQRTLP